MTSPKKAGQPDEYKEFLRSLELRGLALVDCQFGIDRAKFFESDEEQLFLEIEFDVLKMDKGAFELKASFSISASPSKEQAGSMHLKAVYELHFHCEGAKPQNKNLADRFANSEARLVLWPYLRELVSDMTTRASVPPITLPLVGKRQKRR